MEMNFKLKKYFIAISILCNSLVALSQSIVVDQRIIDMYGSSKVAKMETEQPQTLAYLNYYIQHGYQVLTDIPEKKIANFPDISTVKFKISQKPLTADDLKSLNILMLDIVREQDQFLTYRIGNTELIIVFIAPSQVMSEFLLTQENK
jgi:hypothetical protein